MLNVNVLIDILYSLNDSHASDINFLKQIVSLSQ
jgi:hypothetical protein